MPQQEGALALSAPRPLDPRGPRPPLYDPKRLAAEARALGWSFLRRKWGFWWAMARAGWGLWRVNRPGGIPMADQVAFARWSRQEMVRQGAAFIKFGQMLSTRVDAFPAPVLAELAKLQDQVPAFAFEELQAIVEADLGRPMGQAFDWVDPQPLAAASMGQVHAARLKDGTEVVVKVLRPGLERQLIQDLTLMRDLATWLAKTPWALRLIQGSEQTPWVALVDRLGHSMYEQLDLWREGLAGERFRANFASEARISAPGIHWSHSSTRVLTQERIYGHRFDDEHAIRAAGIDYLDMANLGIKAFVKQIFEDAFFHADTHPGNVFVTPEGSLIYLDFGMVEELEPNFQRALVEMFVHIIQRDWDAFLADLVRADVVPPEVPKEELLPIFTEVMDAQFGFAGERKMTLQEVSDRFYKIMQRYPFRLPDKFLFLTRTAATMEGVVFRADPSFKFLPVALPFFAKLVLRHVDVEDPWILQDVLRATQQGGNGLGRLSDLVATAISEQPEAADELAAKMVQVLAHPKAAPLRRELVGRLLAGGEEGLAAALPEGFQLGPQASEALMAFLSGPEGQALAFAVLEDPQLPAAIARLTRPSKLPTAAPGVVFSALPRLNFARLVLLWLGTPEAKQRAARALEQALGSEAWPWDRFVVPAGPQGLLAGWHTGAWLAGGGATNAERGEALKALAEVVGQVNALPVVARGVVSGWRTRLASWNPFAPKAKEEAPKKAGRWGI